MEYEVQSLKAGGLTGQFETIKNFKITRPEWKKSFGEDFFLTAADKLTPVNIGTVNVLDIEDMNGTDIVLSTNGTTSIYLSVNGVVWHTGVKGESERIIMRRGGYDIRTTTTVTAVGSFDPVKDVNDVFEFGYIRLQLAIMPVAGEYITFTSNTINLQGVTTKVHYVQDGYAYIRGTNLYGTLPIVGESVQITTKIGDVAVIAEKSKVVLVNALGTGVTLYECDDDDEIIDIEKFNSTIFILTKKYVFFGRNLVNCNVNVYPLDFFDNMTGGTRLIGFGKLLILFGKENQIISPINGTEGSLGYVTVDLNYGHKLFSKYSALSSQGSLYVLQDDKEFVKVNIISTSNSEYDVETETVMDSVQGMLDNISGDVYMSKNDKYISIINNHGDNTTTSYNYHLVYKHWATWEYEEDVRHLGDKPFGSTQFEYSTGIVPQEISFSLGGSELYHMKTCFFVKMILVAETDSVPDYILTIDKYIGGLKLRKTVELKDYPINNKITSNNNLLGYEQFGEVGLYAEPEATDLGYIINVQVRINETADLFVFTLTNKENIITYGGSVIGYRNMLPEVTAYNYITKQSTR